MDAIVVAVPAGWEEPAILLAEELGCAKVSRVIAGGATRAESVWAALAEVPGEAARDPRPRRGAPCLPEEVLERVLVPLAEGWDGVVPALPLSTRQARARRERS